MAIRNEAGALKAGRWDYVNPLQGGRAELSLEITRNSCTAARTIFDQSGEVSDTDKCNAPLEVIAINWLKAAHEQLLDAGWRTARRYQDAHLINLAAPQEPAPAMVKPAKAPARVTSTSYPQGKASGKAPSMADIPVPFGRPFVPASRGLFASLGLRCQFRGG